MKTNTLLARKTDNEDENWEYYVERMKYQQEDVQYEDEEPSMVNADTTNPRVGDWVLLKFLSKKLIEHYIMQVISFE
ncbi:hypothetical protein PR048_012573 [Dryococelus australis]|uniref:Uncharacterized protein n=1 Tax=Dryococelus australis TaxID=614101 RepID=A0ABQ9HPV2_9NEOP|nr:hypothetical protein PR048_012573 [Dryococelus australis]